MEKSNSIGALNFTQKGFRNPEKETTSMASQEATALHLMQSQRETSGKTQNPLLGLSRQCHFGISELSRILEVLQSEEQARLGGLSTSFDGVENAIAICMSQCLSDCSEQKKSIPYILSLLKDYKVVSPLQDGSPCVSLQRIHVILQDNFEGSSFCKLLNILLAGHLGVAIKTIDFY